MTNRICLAFVISLSASACHGPSVEDEFVDEALEEDAARQRQQAEIGRLRLEKIADGQGCGGRILQGDELVQIIVGRHHTHAPHDADFQTYNAFVQFWYQPDGTLNYNAADPRVPGRYDVHDTDVCHQTLAEQCFRFVENADGRIFKEVLDGEYPENLQLSCVPLRIERLGNDQ